MDGVDSPSPSRSSPVSTSPTMILPRSPRQIRLFQEPLRTENATAEQYWIKGRVAEELRTVGCKLEKLSVCYTAEAGCFFVGIESDELCPQGLPNEDWLAAHSMTCFPSLTDLVLTSDFISPAYEPNVAQFILRGAAATVIYCMPELRRLELWNAGKGFGFIFRFHYPDGDTREQPEIEIVRSWDIDLAPALEVWRCMFGLRHPRKKPLVVKDQVKPPASIKGHADMIPLLENSALVLDPVSSHRIHCERQESLPEPPPSAVMDMEWLLEPIIHR